MNRVNLICLQALLLISNLAFAQKGIKIVAGGTAPPGTERRLALVIGNRSYTRPGASLTNPQHDADDMAAVLDELGFTVIKKNNLNRVSFEQTIDEFGTQLKNYDVGLFYYSGHGVQFQGENYLVPSDESMSSEPQIRYQCVNLGRILSAMEGSGATTNVVILDACRSNPFPKESKGPLVGGGLTIPRNPPGTLVAFATSENSTADDNSSARNGLFTSELLKYIRQPNRSLSQILTDTRKGVYIRSNKAQTPADYNKLLGDFVFVTLPTNPPANTKPEPNQPATGVDLPFMELVRIPGGTFDMGSTEGEANEKPVHAVTVSAFLMGQYEVTVSQFAQFVAATNYQTDAEKGGRSLLWNPKTNKFVDSTGINWRYDALGNRHGASTYNHPVVHVSHNDAVAFCSWLSKREGRVYRLPTEAEWEWAAGNGTAHTKYSWGTGDPGPAAGGNVADETFAGAFNDTLTYYIFKGYQDGYASTAPVGSFKANAFGLHDMTGNVWEWCADWYGDDYYANSTNSVNPTGPGSGSYRVLRGGGWRNNPRDCRVAYRRNLTPSFRNYDIGFRVRSQAQ